jgi:cysteine desulfurase / selenocysteine lyase
MPEPTVSDDPFRDLREAEFGEMGSAIYLNAASLGPLPRRAASAAAAFDEKRVRASGMRGDDFSAPPAAVRERVARLLGAAPEEIALGGNTSFGINIASLGLRAPPGSTVLASDREFPANILPWMHSRDLRLELVPVLPRGIPDEDAIVERVERGDVAILTVSSVQFLDGYRADLDRLGGACRRAGTLLVVDAIQSVGQIPLDVSRVPADVVAVGGHKWLCGPFGSGFAYVRREVQDRLDPVVIGWSSARSSEDLEHVLDYRLEMLPDARRYEVGTPPFQVLASFAESLAVVEEASPPRVERYLATLLEPLRRWLGERPEVTVLGPPDPARQSAILAFRTPRTLETFRALRAGGVEGSLREGAIRLSPHFYNTESQIGRVIDMLEHIEAGGWH